MAVSARDRLNNAAELLRQAQLQLVEAGKALPASGPRSSVGWMAIHQGNALRGIECSLAAMASDLPEVSPEPATTPIQPA